MTRLRQLALALVVSSALTAAGTSVATAAPVLAFAAIPFGAVVTEVAVTFAIQGISSWIDGLINPDKNKPGSAAASGIRGTVSSTGDGPLSFIMGTRATAGTLAYRGTWGTAGSTPNAYYVEERILSDVPLAACTGLFIDKKAYTVLWGDPPTAQGYPLSEARIGGVDYAWFKFADGTQTVADSYLTGKFGADADHPYTSDMIGRGQAKGVLTLRLNKTLWKNGFPEWMVETSGIKLYNPAKDSTVGGSGSHRLATPSTWEPSDVLPVHIYNALLGIKWGSEWVWGGQNISQTMLPTTNWIAAIAEASTLVDKADTSTEKQFRGGFEVTGDMEPAAYIEEALKACAGRFAEIGGTFKMLCGLPAASVFSFTDSSVVVTRDQAFEPFPAPDATINTIYSKYYEPSQGWTTKDVPPRFDTALEAQDGGRRGPQNTYEMVSSATQAQRLDFAAVAEARRLATLSLSLGPIASELEPLDMVDYTAARFGFTSKLLLIETMDDEETYEQGNVLLREVDPADHGSYDAASDELPVTYPTLSIADVPAVQMSGYQVFALTVLDSAGIARRPDIKVRIPGGLDDVASIKATVRLASSSANVYQGSIPYLRATPAGSYFEVPLNGVFLPAMGYEVQFDEIPFSARATAASNWLAITTPNVGIGAPDLDLLALGQGVLSQLGQVRSLIQQFNALGTILAATDLDHYTQRKSLARSIEVRMGDLEASFTEIIEVALGPGGAIATALESLYAAMGGNTAAVNVRWEAVTAPGGYSARYAITAEVNDGHRRSATMFVDVPTDIGQPTRIGFMAGQTVFFTSGGDAIVVIDEDGVQSSANGVKSINWLTGEEVTVVA